MAQVKVVRVYLNESEKNIKRVLSFLHDEARVQGATVFRGIAGFGKSGEMHKSSIIDMDMDLPVVIEFFDAVDKVDSALQQVVTMVEPSNILHWLATNEVEDVRQ